MSGLWKQHDHDRSRRRDAASKPDYRENFWWSSGPRNAAPSRTGLEELGLRLAKRGSVRTFVKTKRWYTLQALDWKKQLKKELRRITNQHPILIESKKYAFKWAFQRFLKENSLPSNWSASDFNKIKKNAEDRRVILERAIDRATLDISIQTDAETLEKYEHYELSIGITKISKIYQFPEDFDLESEIFAKANST